MISVNELIRWAKENATQGGFIKARDLNDLAEAVDLCSPKQFKLYPVDSDDSLNGEPIHKDKYVIEVNGRIPEHCYDCPAANCESGYCQADKIHRTSDWRPFWCPAHEQEE